MNISHMGEYIMNGTGAVSQFMIIRNAKGEFNETPIDVFYDPSDPESHFTDAEKNGIDKCGNGEIVLGTFIAVFTFFVSVFVGKMSIYSI